MTRVLSEFRGILFDANEIIIVAPAYEYPMVRGNAIHSFKVSFSQGCTHSFGFESKEDAEFGRVTFIDQFCRQK